MFYHHPRAMRGSV